MTRDLFPMLQPETSCEYELTTFFLVFHEFDLNFLKVTDKIAFILVNTFRLEEDT